MKLRLSHYGLAVSSLALAPLFAYGVTAIHAQGKSSAETVALVNTKAIYKTEVLQDLTEGMQWTLQLDENDGKNIGDILPGYKVGKSGARTIVAITKPGKKLAPDQVMRVDQKTGQVLGVFALSQILKEQKDQTTGGKKP